MEAKHTKREWICKGLYRRVATNESILDEVEICKISGNPLEQEIIANAKLIAAAPELFEALQKIKKLYGDRGDYIGEYKLAWDLVVNALKKATE